MEEKKIKMTEAKEKEALQKDEDLDQVTGGVQVKSHLQKKSSLKKS